jgi:hypothetical protein
VRAAIARDWILFLTIGDVVEESINQRARDKA